MCGSSQQPHLLSRPSIRFFDALRLSELQLSRKLLMARTASASPV